MVPLRLVRVRATGESDHIYGVGFAPLGELAEEIGAIPAEPGAGRVPAWLTPEGSLVLARRSAAGASRSGPRAVRRALMPRRCRNEAKARLLWGRVLSRMRRGGVPLSTDPAGAAPTGYVYAEGGGERIPLFEAVHPVTGDQLLATDRREAEVRGYGEPRLLGYIDPSPAADATGSNKRRESPLVKSEVSPPAWSPPCPGAIVDEPAADSTLHRFPVLVRGWAMFDTEAVTRVEVTADGHLLGRARIGLERLDVAADCDCADAPISGWEYELRDDQRLPGSGPVTLAGTVYGSSGRRFALPAVTVHLPAGDAYAPTRAQSPGWVGRDVRLRRRLTARPSPGSGTGPNVLALTHSLTFGGAQLYLVELIERLTRAGWRLTVVSPADGPLRERLEQAGALVHLSPEPAPWEQSVYDSRVRELTAFARSHAPDVVIVNTIGVFYGVEVAARLGLPSVLAVHESLDPCTLWARHLPPHDPGILRRLELALGAASKVVFEAAATRELFIPYAEPERLVTMPYGIDLGAIDRFRSTSTRDAVRRALGIAPEEKLVLCLGTFEHRKAQASLARAFSRVAEQRPEAVLALVGRGGDKWSELYADGVAEYLARSGLEKRVLTRPLTANPFAWHLAADVLVCASDNESLPRVILEAMAFETLVVSTDIFGIPEVVDDGITGFLCQSRDEQELAESLSDALVARPEHQRIRAAAARRVRDRHDADAYAIGFEDLIAELVDQRQTTGSLARSASPTSVVLRPTSS